MRTALEEQIARRLMTSQREAAERRSYDKKQMEMAEVCVCGERGREGERGMERENVSERIYLK